MLRYLGKALLSEEGEQTKPYTPNQHLWKRELELSLPKY